MKGKYFLCYDLSSPKSLRKAAKCCLDSGLARLQKSVYFGEMDHTCYLRLLSRLEELITEETDRILLFPIDRNTENRVVQFPKKQENPLTVCQPDVMFV